MSETEARACGCSPASRCREGDALWDAANVVYYSQGYDAWQKALGPYHEHMDPSEPKVTTYQLLASNGRPIRKATKVVYADGSEVAFTERMSKSQALLAAASQRAWDRVQAEKAGR